MLGFYDFAVQGKGQECERLQQQCADLQDQLHIADADHVKVIRSSVRIYCPAALTVVGILCSVRS